MGGTDGQGDGRAKFYGAMARGWKGTLYDSTRNRVWKCKHSHETDVQARACVRDEMNKRDHQARQDRNKAKETGEKDG